MINRRKYLVPTIASLLCCVTVLADENAANKRFKEIEIRPAFKKILTSNLLLMEVTGAKVVTLPKGRRAIIGVSSTVIVKDSASDLLRAEKVCRMKALANVVAERKGIQVVHIEELKDEIRTVIDDTGEKTTSVESLMKLTKTKVEGIAKDMPVVGRWYSLDGDLYYLAIGVIFDENGSVIPDED